jgi:hypothetical protein
VRWLGGYGGGTQPMAQRERAQGQVDPRELGDRMLTRGRSADEEREQWHGSDARSYTSSGRVHS